ncbi:MAG: S-ribosylhomocysteine lyase [Gammaproteobacteria bacterium]|nr:S-ribosylhomocysteine lyase [Gammaproteobacteria bacterium]
MRKNTNIVESFTIDHTKLAAPFIRLCGTFAGSAGDKVYKYDIRFMQPNKEFMPIEVLHSLEHLLAVNLRKYLSQLIDISPMGCRTGFYLIVMNEKSWDVIATALERSLYDVIDASEVPAANEIECGGAKFHDLEGAKKMARQMLDRKAEWETIYIDEN